MAEGKFVDLVHVLGAVEQERDEEKKEYKNTVSFALYIYVEPELKPSDLKVRLHVHDKKHDKRAINGSVPEATKEMPGFTCKSCFTNVPEGDYTLHIRAVAGEREGHICDKIHLEINDKKSWGGGTSPPIIAVPSSPNVGPGFTAAGYDNPATTQVTGWVTIGGKKYYGTTMAQPPNSYNWGVSFSGLPTGSGQLCIQITGTTAQTCMNITVQ